MNPKIYKQLLIFEYFACNSLFLKDFAGIVYNSLQFGLIASKASDHR